MWSWFVCLGFEWFRIHLTAHSYRKVSDNCFLQSQPVIHRNVKNTVHKKAPKLTKKCWFWIFLKCVGHSESSEEREQITWAGFCKNKHHEVLFCDAKHEAKQQIRIVLLNILSFSTFLPQLVAAMLTACLRLLLFLPLVCCIPSSTRPSSRQCRRCCDQLDPPAASAHYQMPEVRTVINMTILKGTRIPNQFCLVMLWGLCFS